MNRLFSKHPTPDGTGVKANERFSQILKEKQKEVLNGAIKEYLFSAEPKTKDGILDTILDPQNPKEEEDFILNLLSGNLGIKTKNTRVEKLLNEHLFKKTPETRTALKEYIRDSFSESLSKALFTNYMIRNRS